jgi:hypothetical protein
LKPRKLDLDRAIVHSYIAYSQSLNGSFGLVNQDLIGLSESKCFDKIEELTNRPIKQKNGSFKKGFFDVREVKLTPRFLLSIMWFHEGIEYETELHKKLLDSGKK